MELYELQKNYIRTGIKEYNEVLITKHPITDVNITKCPTEATFRCDGCKLYNFCEINIDTQTSKCDINPKLVEEIQEEFPEYFI